MDKSNLTLNIKKLSHDLNFDLVGVAPADFNDKIAKNNFQKWIDNGYHASMKWMENNIDHYLELYSLPYADSGRKLINLQNGIS